LNGIADGLESAVKAVVERVSHASQEMSLSAHNVAGASEQTSRQANAVAAAGEEASTNVQTVASAAEELSASVNEIGRQVSQSTRIAGHAVDTIRRTDQRIAALDAAVQSIGAMVKLINGIAHQTNLLALNATIEAKRAGDAGRGFSVVASEVKSLADQTTKATAEIGRHIGAVQSSTREAVGAIAEVGKVIEEMNQITTMIAAAVEEQGAATNEIARNIQQAAAGTTEVSSNIAGVNKAAGNSSAMAKRVLDTAQALDVDAGLLRQEVDGFVGKVRAAA
jgi:methyl-accepting chemotaxis protein